jgi:hypothetical protein
MRKSDTRIRRNGAYIIKSAASRPVVIEPNGSLNGHAPDVTPEIKSLVAAVLQHRRTHAQAS